MISIYPFDTKMSNLSKPFIEKPTAKFSDLKSIITKLNWSPGWYKNRHRITENFIGALYIGLDFDGTMSLDEAVNNVFCDMRHIIGTTRNHQLPKGDEPAADRFRVVLQMERPLFNRDEYYYQLFTAFKNWDTDKQCVDIVRYFKPCKEIVSIGDGYLWDIKTEPQENIERRKAKAEAAKRQLAAYERINKLPPWIERALSSNNMTHRNPTLYPVIRFFAEKGFDEISIQNKIMDSVIYKNNSTDREFLRGIVASIKCAVKKHGGQYG